MAFGIVEDAYCAFGIGEDYDLDMHATPREIYDRIINDTAKCEELGIKQTKVEKAAIRKRFG